MKEQKAFDVTKAYNFLKSIQDNASHAIIVTNTEGIISSFNKKAEQLLGYKAEELVGNETPSLFHDKNEVFQRMNEFSKKLGRKVELGFDVFVCHCDAGLENEFEWTFVRSDGSHFPVLLSITTIKDGHGKTIGYLGLAQDITDKKILENELIKRNYELENAQELAKLGSWNFSTKTGEMSWSKEMYKIFPEKIEDGEPSLEKHKSTIHKDDVDNWEAIVGKCAQDGLAYKMLFRTHKLNKPEQVVWIEARGAGDKVNGEVVFLQGTCQDVSEVIESKLKLEQRAEELSIAEKLAKQAEEAKTQFLANMSHEIRTPMNGIIGVLELLSETSLDEEQQDLIETITTSSKSLMYILSDVLDLSKIDSGKLELEYKTFNLSSCIADVVGLMSSNSISNNTSLTFEVDKNLSDWYIGDEIRIRQILTNLISNAVKFTTDGDVHVLCNIIKSIDNIHEIEVTVKDNGIGICPIDQKNLFKPFIQADTSVTRRFGGTGLGLAICQKLTKLMGGEISLKSEKGVGSEFKINISLEKTIGLATTASKPLGSGIISKQYPHRILMVEDNLVNQKVVTLILKKLGYECDLAINGKVALEMLRNNGINHYSIIFMDMQMPVMDGLTATRKIIETYQEQSPPIIALTANAFSSDKQSCLSEGMADFLSKPIKKEVLKDVLIKFSKSE